MNKYLMNNGHIDSLIKGTPVKVGGMTIVPNGDVQKQLVNVKVNGWSNDVEVLFDQDKNMEIRMKQYA